MTAGQLFVLVLLLGAFGAGWYAGASGAREKPRANVDADLRDADEAVDRALRAYRTMAGLDDAEARAAARDALDARLAELRARRDGLVAVLGESNPLADDLEQATAALELLSADEDGPRDLQAALERSAREARERFRRSAIVVEHVGRTSMPDRRSLRRR